MGNTGLILGIGVLVIGGWCFLAGPCKGWLRGQAENSYLGPLGNSEAAQIIRDGASGKISMEEVQRRGQELRQRSLYTRSGYRY
jgi:hypothetical protein